MISIQKFERDHGMMSCEEQNYRIELVFSNGELREAVLASIRENEDNYDRDDLLELFCMTDLKACIETYIYLDTLARDKVMDYIQEAIDLLNGTEPYYDSTFALDFAKEKAIRDIYEAAKEAGNEKLKEETNAAHRAHEAEIEARGAAYCRLYREYETAIGCGNSVLDIHDVVWDKDVEGLISCMREHNIKRFTFSSTWSSAVETAWLFQQNGCRLIGLVEINSQHKRIMSDEYEKAHGYLFSLE